MKSCSGVCSGIGCSVWVVCPVVVAVAAAAVAAVAAAAVAAAGADGPLDEAEATLSFEDCVLGLL